VKQSRNLPAGAMDGHKRAEGEIGDQVMRKLLDLSDSDPFWLTKRRLRDEQTKRAYTALNVSLASYDLLRSWVSPEAGGADQ
jgi:hypothetical protein